MTLRIFTFAIIFLIPFISCNDFSECDPNIAVTWNNIHLQLIYNYIKPPLAARNLFMFHNAMNDAFKCSKTEKVAIEYTIAAAITVLNYLYECSYWLQKPIKSLKIYILIATISINIAK